MKKYFFILLFLTVAFYQYFKSLPKDLSFASEIYSAESVKFLKDITYMNSSFQRQSEQQIFDEILSNIASAKKFILLDMFLFNDFLGKDTEPYRNLTQELTQTLIKQKTNHPHMQIIFITDPVNVVYGGAESIFLNQLKNHGIDVVITDLNVLRDSNPLYSTFWRIFLQWFGNNSKSGWIPNPFSKDKVTLRSYFQLLNFKANHRKVFIADQNDDLVGIITSANPHDGSSAHSNVAVKFNGKAVEALLQSEQAILNFSSSLKLPPLKSSASASGELMLQILTESKIHDAALSIINQTQSDEELLLAMFYLSDRQIISALKAAEKRKVSIKILLDPNKDAFGRTKNGIPNRPVADELHQTGIPIRWCDTHGEQCHSKLLFSKGKDNQGTVLLGSANFTRRNLHDYNLETNILVKGPLAHDFFKEVSTFFDEAWENTENKAISVDYQKYAESETLKYLLYRFMEASGISAF